MKLLHVEIRECRECPFCFGLESMLVGKSYGAMLYHCWHAKHEPLVPDRGVPEWCPLPDKAP
jgi:hypothetical protein